MNSNLTDLRPIGRGAYRVVSSTSHYRIVGGRVYRDVVAELPTGERRIVAVLEDAA